MNSLRLAWLFTQRDRRAGELRLLAAAVMVAVAALSSVGFFVERASLALQSRAQQGLGADLLIASDHDGLQALEREALRRGLRVAQTLTFPSMLRAEGASLTEPGSSLLVSVKAVSDTYPLRGALRATEGRIEDDAAVQGAPAAGTVWLDPAAMQTLGLKIGDRVGLGEASLRVARILTFEPDRSLSFLNVSPRLILALADLPATELLGPGSRVSWRLLVAGEATAVKAFAGWAKSQLTRGQRIESAEAARPELAAILERGQQFLGLIAVSAAILAAVAMALAARRFAQRHWDACAVLRAMGLTRRRLVTALLLELTLVGLAAGTVGVLLGTLGQALLSSVAAPWLGLSLPAGSGWPALQAMVAGLSLLWGFGVVPFVRLAAVTPLRALRRDEGAPARSVWLAVGVALSTCAGLVLWFAQDRVLGLTVLAGLVVAVAVFGAVGFALVGAAGPIRRGLGSVSWAPSLSVALASIRRHRVGSIVQMVALALGMMALVLLTLTRHDLFDSWQRAMPANAPNRFIINIQPGQRQAVIDALESAGVRSVVLYPMVRGRLIAVNGQPLQADRLTSARAQRLLEREFNLSYMAEPQPEAPVQAGRWLDPAAAEVSVEAGIMRTLDLALGDQLTFDIAGEAVAVRVVGTRKVAWDSMKPNFFMVLSPAALAQHAQSWITAFYLAPQQPGLTHELVARFPNLTVLDTSALLLQVRTTLQQIVLVIELMFVLTLVAGLLVVVAALAGSRDERMAEAALLRALGASRAQLRRSHRIELALLGGLAGLLAGLAATALGAVLADRVFGFVFTPRWWGLGGCVAIGAGLAMLAGGWGLRKVLDNPPLSTLRER